MNARPIALSLVALLLLGLAALIRADEPDFSAARIAQLPYPYSLLKDPGDLRHDGVVFLLPYGQEQLPPNCRVHLMSQAQPENEQVYPCLEWVHPPSFDLLRGWFESDDAMSPQPGRFTTGPGHLMQPPVPVPRPAGRVVAPGYRSAPGVVLRLLAGEVEPRAGRYPLDVFRSVLPENWGRGALMPEGSTVGWLWDLAEERVLALSRPFKVAPGNATRVPLAVPSGGAYLMAVLGRESEAQRAQEETTVLLRGPRDKREPDFLVATYFQVYAFWYDLPAGFWAIEAESSGSLLPRQEVDLAKGEIVRVKAELLPRPTLELELALPPELEGDSLQVQVARLDDGEEVARRKWGRGQRRDVIGGLPATILELRIATRLGVYAERFDLRPALNARLKLAPRLTAIVCRVGQPAAVLDPPPAKTTWRLFRGTTEGTGVWDPPVQVTENAPASGG